MLICGADCETTGLLAEDGTAGDHRLIEFYAGIWNSVTRERISQKLVRIHPQRSIAPAAQAVHKISLADLEHCMTWDYEAPAIKKFLEEADLIVGHNWDGFDKPFINSELRRVGIAPIDRPTFDTMLSGRWATAMGTVPNLGALCWASDVPYDPALAHKADYDVKCMMEAYFKGLDWGWFKLPEAA